MVPIYIVKGIFQKMRFLFVSLYYKKSIFISLEVVYTKIVEFSYLLWCLFILVFMLSIIFSLIYFRKYVESFLKQYFNCIKINNCNNISTKATIETIDNETNTDSMYGVFNIQEDFNSKINMSEFCKEFSLKKEDNKQNSFINPLYRNDNSNESIKKVNSVDDSSNCDNLNRNNTNNAILSQIDELKLKERLANSFYTDVEKQANIYETLNELNRKIMQIKIPGHIKNDGRKFQLNRNICYGRFYKNNYANVRFKTHETDKKSFNY